MDTSKSLAELSGVDWGPAPAAAKILMRERHELRRTPLRDLPDSALVHLLAIGCEADILIPIMLDRLTIRPEAIGMLCAVLGADPFDWRSRPDYVHRVRDRVDASLNDIAQITDDLDRLELESIVLRSYAGFEYSLSSIPPEFG